MDCCGETWWAPTILWLTVLIGQLQHQLHGEPIAGGCSRGISCHMGALWSMCRVFSCVIGRGCLLWPVCSLGKTLLAFALLHSVFQGQICLLLQVFLDFLSSFASYWQSNLNFTEIKDPALQLFFFFLFFLQKRNFSVMGVPLNCKVHFYPCFQH